MKTVIFLDRDGVINKDLKNITCPQQFKIIDGVSDAIRKINSFGYLTIIVTNQPIIAKGFCTFLDIEKIHKKMRKELMKRSAHIDAIYVCPHHPERGFANEVRSLKIQCNCRKPKPGLIKEACKDYKVDLISSWMIGDKDVDIQSAHAAGLKNTALISKKTENSYENLSPTIVAQNLYEAVEVILQYK